MSTRSYIGTARKDGKIDRLIYCHYDGYPSHHLPILQGYYNSLDLADALIDLGGISSLGTTINPSPLVKEYGFDYETNPAFRALPEEEKRLLIIMDRDSEEYTRAYHRDRGEALEIFEHPTVNDIQDSWADYFYLFIDGTWHCFPRGFFDGLNDTKWEHKLKQYLNGEIDVRLDDLND